MSTLSSPLLLADKALHSPVVLPPSATQVHRACSMLMRSHFIRSQEVAFKTSVMQVALVYKKLSKNTISYRHNILQTFKKMNLRCKAQNYTLHFTYNVEFHYVLEQYSHYFPAFSNGIILKSQITVLDICASHLQVDFYNLG